MSEAGVEGTKTGETAWRTSRFHCFFNMDLSGSIVNGSGGAGTTVTWGDSQEFANIATTWSSTNGYATVGFYMIDGQAENINNSASGAQGTASIIVQTKQQAGSGDSISYEPIPHTAWAGTGLDSLNNSGGLNISGTATTQVWAVGYPE
jgi:hypothetical protein